MVDLEAESLEPSLVGDGWSMVGAKETVGDFGFEVDDEWDREKMGKKKVVLDGALLVGEFLMAICLSGWVAGMPWVYCEM